MKTIEVILPTNNRDMLKKQDLGPYQSDDCYFQLVYVDTRLNQLNSLQDVEEVIPKVIERIEQAKDKRVDGIIIHGFGDVAITKQDENSIPPIVSLGRMTVRQLARMTATKFTVIPTQPGHETFVESLLAEEELLEKYIRAPKPIGLNPNQIRKSNDAMKKIFEAADAAVAEGADCLSVACGSFIGLADKLQRLLQNKYGSRIKVVDPAETAYLNLKDRLL